MKDKERSLYESWWESFATLDKEIDSRSPDDFIMGCVLPVIIVSFLLGMLFLRVILR
jgi:hypothetical protein